MTAARGQLFGLLGGDGPEDGRTAAVAALMETGGFHHRPPSGGRVPKVFVRSLRYMDDIASGRFLRWPIDADWWRRNVDAAAARALAEDCRTFGDAAEAVEDALLELRRARRPGWWPADKSRLPRTFPDFLLDERAGRSLFLSLRSFGARRLWETPGRGERPPEGLAAAEASLGLDWAPAHQRILRRAASLDAWHKRTRDALWRSTEYGWLYHSSDFWASYAGWLADLLRGGQPMAGHFEPYGRTHRAWMAWASSSLGVDWSALAASEDEVARGFSDV